MEAIETFRTKQVVDVEMPKGYTPILEGEGILGKRARSYLTERGFDLTVLDRAGIGYCNEHGLVDKENDIDEDFFGYIIVPFKRNGLLVYYIGRDYIGNFLRYKNPAVEKFNVGKGDLLFNEDALE